MANFTHIDEKGNAIMVDVGGKAATERRISTCSPLSALVKDSARLLRYSPVSYTHLYVYKRQRNYLLPRIKMLLFHGYIHGQNSKRPVAAVRPFSGRSRRVGCVSGEKSLPNRGRASVHNIMSKNWRKHK